MMYSEFINKIDLSESYISYTEYTEKIEPLYMDCELSKDEFCKKLYYIFSTMVTPIVENAIKSMPLEDKENYLYGDDETIEKYNVPLIDKKARYLAYKWFELYLSVQ